MPSTTPRQNVRSAFKTILVAANLGVTVHERMPYEGAEQRSVVLQLVSGSNRSPGIGLRFSSAERATEEPRRIQIDCYHDDPAEAEKLADKVGQAIMDHLDVLRSTYDIHHVRMSVEIDTLPDDPLVKLTRIRQDWEFFTHRAVT